MAKKIVYTTESGTKYTKKKILKIAKGNKEYASYLLDCADWQHIETIVDEDLREGLVKLENGKYVFVDQP